MIYIPATNENLASARRLAKQFPRSLSTCIRRYESLHDPVSDELERPVQAFLAAAQRIKSVGHIWILDPTLVISEMKDVHKMLCALDACDVAVHAVDGGEIEDRQVCPDIVGFAPSGVGFAAFAMWVHACLTWEDEPLIENPAGLLLKKVCEGVVDTMGGDVISMVNPPLERGPVMWPEVR